jgi:hypothetical protein
MAAFIFWHDTIRDFDHRDRRQHEQILARVYGGDSWHVPALLEETRSATGDLYFDAVSRVDVPSRCQGNRVWRSERPCSCRERGWGSARATSRSGCCRWPRPSGLAVVALPECDRTGCR